MISLPSSERARSKLKNLRLVRNRSKRTADHTHTTGYTFFVVESLHGPEFITSDCFYAAGTANMDVPFCEMASYGQTDLHFPHLHTFFLINIRIVRLPWKWHLSDRLPYTDGQDSLCTYCLLHICYPRQAAQADGITCIRGGS